MSKASKAVKSQETWWRVSGVSIVPHHFARSTDTCLIDFDGQKRAKHTQWGYFFPSKAAAIAHIRRGLTGDVRNAEAALKRARQALAEFEKSSPPPTSEER